MPRAPTLKDLVHRPGMSRQDQVLLCLAAAPHRPKQVTEIKDIAMSAGLRTSRAWNFSSVLGSLKGDAVRVSEGWEVTASGRERARILAQGGPAVTKAPVSALRTLLPRIKNPDISTFLTEAIACYEAKHFRASVVLSWVGAMAVLYDHVIVKHLAAFNGEARRRDAKWRDAKNPDDLARMKESDFLQVLEAISVLGKSVKTELEAALKLRNGCGHPNSLKVAEHRVASHLEVLILNVFTVFV